MYRPGPRNSFHPGHRLDPRNSQKHVHGGTSRHHGNQSGRHERPYGGKIDKNAPDVSVESKIDNLAAQISAQIQKDGIFDEAVQTVVESALQQPACTALSERLKRNMAHFIRGQFDRGLAWKRNDVKQAALRNVLHDPSAERFYTSALYQIVQDSDGWQRAMSESGLTSRIQELVQEFVPEHPEKSDIDCLSSANTSSAQQPVALSSDTTQVDSIDRSIESQTTVDNENGAAECEPGGHLEVESLVQVDGTFEQGEQAMDMELDEASPKQSEAVADPDLAPHDEFAKETYEAAKEVSDEPSRPVVEATIENAQGHSFLPDALTAQPSNAFVIDNVPSPIVCEEPASPDPNQSSNSSDYGSNAENCDNDSTPVPPDPTVDINSTVSTSGAHFPLTEDPSTTESMLATVNSEPKEVSCSGVKESSEEGKKSIDVCQPEIMERDESAESLYDPASPDVIDSSSVDEIPAAHDIAVAESKQDEQIEDVPSPVTEPPSADVDNSSAPLDLESVPEQALPKLDSVNSPLAQCQENPDSAAGTSNDPVQPEAAISSGVIAAQESKSDLVPVSDSDDDDGAVQSASAPALAPKVAVEQKIDSAPSTHRSAGVGRKKRKRSKSRTRSSPPKRRSSHHHTHSERPKRERRKRNTHGDYIYY